MAWDAVRLGHWLRYCSGLSSETYPELATQLPRIPAISSLEPSSFWSQGAFLLPDVWWQSDQVVVLYLCSLLTWPIKLYIPNELLSDSSNADLVKALLGLQYEEQAQKQH